MATKIGVREFRDNASKILRQVSERRQTFDICSHDRVVARLVPAEPDEAELQAAWDEWNRKADELAKEISAMWRGPKDAVEAVREQRDTYVYRGEPR